MERVYQNEPLTGRHKRQQDGSGEPPCTSSGYRTVIAPSCRAAPVHRERVVLFFLINLATAPGYLFSPRLARWLGSVRTVVITRAFSVAFLAAMAIAPTYPIAAVLYLVRLVAGTLALPVRQSYVMGVVEPEERATAAALSNLPSQLIGVGSPALAGYLMSAVSIDLPLELAALLQGINALLYYLFFRHISPPEELAAVTGVRDDANGANGVSPNAQEA